MGKLRTINPDEEKPLRTFLCHWPLEIHSMAKLHASLKGETINEWVIKAIIEKLGRENTLIRDKSFKD